MYLRIFKLNNASYSSVYQLMQRSIHWRQKHVLLIVEHPPTYTLGFRFKQAALRKPSDIPLIQTDRGGDITYHGPGQIVFYPLCNISNLNSSATGWVHSLEDICSKTLCQLGIKTHLIPTKPGIYIDNNKVASIGVRIRKFRSYHGLSLNYDMNLIPFDNIHPCGYDDQVMTNLYDHLPKVQNCQKDNVIKLFVDNFCDYFHLKHTYDSQTA